MQEIKNDVLSQSLAFTRPPFGGSLACVPRAAMVSGPDALFFLGVLPEKEHTRNWVILLVTCYISAL